MQTEAAIGKTRLSMAKQQAKNDERAALMGAVGSLGGMYAGYKLPGMLSGGKGMTMAQAGEAYKGTHITNQTFQQRNKSING
jgi:hypothetical protein